MKSALLLLSIPLTLVLMAGCGPKVGASAKDPGPVKPGEIREPGADIAKDPGSWKGSIVEGSVPDARGKDQTQAPPITEGLSDVLGGYSFVLGEKDTCRLHLTGMDITGTCKQTPSGYVLEPKVIAGMKVEEAKNDPILKSAVKPYTLTLSEDGKKLLLRMEGGKTVEFENPKTAGKQAGL